MSLLSSLSEAVVSRGFLCCRGMESRKRSEEYPPYLYLRMIASLPFCPHNLIELMLATLQKTKVTTARCSLVCTLAEHVGWGGSEGPTLRDRQKCRSDPYVSGPPGSWNFYPHRCCGGLPLYQAWSGDS
jgi:hypothetical protein